MKIAYFDCPSGAAGDMILGALVDAGVPFVALRDGLARLGVGGYTLERRQVMKGAFRATKVDVRLDEAPAGGDASRRAGAGGVDDGSAGRAGDRGAPGAGDSSAGRAGDSSAGRTGKRGTGGAGERGEGDVAAPVAGGGHGPAAHAHEAAHRHGPRERLPHRDLPAILGIIAASGLPDPVRDSARRIFTRLAEAEARVHGTTPEQVQFHDVGAVDAIVDVTGACIGLHLLGIEAVHCSALPIGGGFVRGPHGRMPVPAPGTAELLKGFPVVDTGVRRELVTPTGAAILTTLATSSGRMPAMTVTAIGYGAGTIDLETPNVVRLFVGEAAPGDPVTETIEQVETTVDDMSPQLYEPLMERLFEAGALDVYLTPVLMKKSRPGVVVTALCPPGGAAALARVCFEESTTIGVRWTTYARQRLPREMATVETSLGPVAFKVSRLGGRVVTATPEFDDVRRLARSLGVPVRQALDQVRAEGRRLLS